MNTYVFDAEWMVKDGDDIVLDAKRLHCVIFKELDKECYHRFSGDTLYTMYQWLKSNVNATYIGHNILNADLEVFRRLLGIPFRVGADSIVGTPCTFIDTYTMSKRNNPDRLPAYYKGKSQGVHGLKPWGIRTGLQKPEVDDWTSQPLEVYIHRCEADVVNNEAVYHMLLEELNI